jgi:hypothetical protein
MRLHSNALFGADCALEVPRELAVARAGVGVDAAVEPQPAVQRLLGRWREGGLELGPVVVTRSGSEGNTTTSTRSPPSSGPRRRTP